MGQENFVIALDDILQKLGPFGKYNIVNYALLLFPIYLAGMYGQVFVFEALDIDYKCKISECENGNNLTWLSSAIPAENDEFSRCYKHAFRKNITIANGSCTVDDFDTKVIETCDSYDYGDQDSAVKDFDLGCQNWKRTLIGTIHNAGLFISLPVTGIISDKYGRKVALSVASLMNGIFGFLRSFSVNYVMLVVLEFLEAALGAGAYSTAFVLAMELVGPKGRVFGNTIINAVYVMGLMTLSGLSWWLEDWRQLLRIIYTPAMLVFSYLWILNESVRWLLSKGRNDEAIAILNKAAKMNKVDISDDAVLTTPLKSVEKDTEVKVEVPEKEDTAKEPSNFVKVFKSSIIRNRVFVCSFLWITCTFVYYGLSINSVSLVGNKYVNFILVVFVEIPANFACLFLLDRYGRKRPLIIMYILSACLCVSLSFIPKGAKWLSLVLYLSGKFSITVAYSCVYIYVSEVFPTSVRQSMLAVCSSLGRVGSTLAPLTPLLAIHYYKNLPVIIFGSLALTASILVFTLPETINVPLPNTVEEAEMLSKKKKHSELE